MMHKNLIDTVGILGAGATFGASTTATATTNALGVATAPLLKANSRPGTFTVSAAVDGALDQAVFDLANEDELPSSPH